MKCETKRTKFNNVIKQDLWLCKNQNCMQSLHEIRTKNHKTNILLKLNTTMEQKKVCISINKISYNL